MRRGENRMQGQRQFHHPQVGPQMPAVDGQLGDQLVADFVGQMLQLLQRQFLHMRRVVHHVEITAHSFLRGSGGFKVNSPAAFFPTAESSIRPRSVSPGKLGQLALLIARQQRFQRQVLRLHRLDDRFEPFQRLFKGWIFHGLVRPRTFRICHGNSIGVGGSGVKFRFPPGYEFHPGSISSATPARPGPPPPAGESAPCRRPW